MNQTNSAKKINLNTLTVLGIGQITMVINSTSWERIPKTMATYLHLKLELQSQLARMTYISVLFYWLLDKSKLPFKIFQVSRQQTPESVQCGGSKTKIMYALRYWWWWWWWWWWWFDDYAGLMMWWFDEHLPSSDISSHPSSKAWCLTGAWPDTVLTDIALEPVKTKT